MLHVPMYSYLLGRKVDNRSICSFEAPAFSAPYHRASSIGKVYPAYLAYDDILYRMN